MEYEIQTQKVLFDDAELAALMSGIKYDVIFQNCFSKQNPLLKCNVVTDFNMEKILLQITLSNVC
jgi:hypothetical protein